MLYETSDWIPMLLDLTMVEPRGRVGHYCMGAKFLAGRTVRKATGRTLPEYAKEHLFGPLGIRRADWTWNHDLTSANKRFGMMSSPISRRLPPA